MKRPLLSVLDFAPILSGHTAGESLGQTVNLAIAAESMGYHRYWIAEHHNMGGLGSSAPEILMAHVAGLTTKIKVGSGGMMLPNHSTLHVAEIFRTLETLFPGRIDLGLGRAPGAKSETATLLRGPRELAVHAFPEEFDRLINWLNDQDHDSISAIPSQTAMPDVWVLGSSDFGAQFAADRGLPFSFAQHFSSLPPLAILRLYHETFRPSKWYQKPKAMIACHIICAETDAEAQELALSTDLSSVLTGQSGKSHPLPSVEEARAYPMTEKDWQDARSHSPRKFVGSPETIKKYLNPYLNSELVDEVMILTMIHDQKKRIRSYELISGLSGL